MWRCHRIPSYPCIQSKLFGCPDIILHEKAVFELGVVLVFASTLRKRIGTAQHEICQRITSVGSLTSRGSVKSEMPHGSKIIQNIVGSAYGLHPEFKLLLSVNPCGFVGNLEILFMKVILPTGTGCEFARDRKVDRRRRFDRDILNACLLEIKGERHCRPVIELLASYPRESQAIQKRRRYSPDVIKGYLSDRPGRFTWAAFIHACIITQISCEWLLELGVIDTTGQPVLPQVPINTSRIFWLIINDRVSGGKRTVRASGGRKILEKCFRYGTELSNWNLIVRVWVTCYRIVDLF